MAERLPENVGNRTTSENGDGATAGEWNEPLVDQLCADFRRFVEEYVLQNLFTLAENVRWSIYVQLRQYYTGRAHRGVLWQPARNPSPTGDDEFDTSNDEPPILTRET